MCFSKRSLAARLSVALVIAALAAATPAAQGTFEPVERWRDAIASGNDNALRALYSQQPPATILTPTGALQSPDSLVRYLITLRKSGLASVTVEPIRSELLRDDLKQVVFEAAATFNSTRGRQTFYLTISQLWMREQTGWRIINESRTDMSRLHRPTSLETVIYDEHADARAAIRNAVERATREHKRVLLVFGGNWCYDCHVLDLALRHSELTPLVQANYEVVDVDIGEMNRNLDIARQYVVPLDKGVPALAVLDSEGRLLFSQQNGEFESAQRFGPEDIIALLNRWKPRNSAPQ